MYINRITIIYKNPFIPFVIRSCHKVYANQYKLANQEILIETSTTITELIFCLEEVILHNISLDIPKGRYL